MKYVLCFLLLLHLYFWYFFHHCLQRTSNSPFVSSVFSLLSAPRNWKSVVWNKTASDKKLNCPFKICVIYFHCILVWETEPRVIILSKTCFFFHVVMGFVVYLCYLTTSKYIDKIMLQSWGTKRYLKITCKICISLKSWLFGSC